VDTGLSETARVVDHAAALDAAVDVLDAHPAARDAPMHCCLRARKFTATWLSGRHDYPDVVERERQEAQILEQPAARWSGVRCRLGNPLSMGAAGIGPTQKEESERGIDQQHVVPRVALFLATITAPLLKRVLGACDASCDAIMATRGKPGVGADRSAGVGGSVVGTTNAVASASATPRRRVNSASDRRGASPSMRSVVCRTASKTSIH
jgi:hypothetical protein